MSAQTMFSLAPAAIEAWSALATAIVAFVGVPFLLWDRFRRKPHQVSGYLALREDRGELEVFVYSELGERLILNELGGRPFFSLASRDTRTLAQKKAGLKRPTIWMTRHPLRKVAEAGHTGNDPLAVMRIRTSTDNSLRMKAWRALAQPTIVARGVLPYRSRGGRFRVELALPESNLREAVLRMERKRTPVS